MSRILITGATGLLGSELTHQLVRDQQDIRVLTRATSSLAALGNSAENVERVVGDVTDAASIRAAMRGVTHVYHVAGFVAFGGKRDRELLHAINVRGTANVIDAALDEGIVRLVHTSSMAAFGRPEGSDELIDEESTWTSSKQNTEYAYTKYLAELEVHRGIAEGLDAVLVNPSVIFGIGRPGENTRRIVEKVRDRRLPASPKGGTNVVDVRDVAEGHRLAMTKGRTGERYFLGSENLPWRQIFADIASAFGVRPPDFVAPPPMAIAIGAAAEFWARVQRRTPQLSRETARNANRFYRYSNEKAVTELGASFRPFYETAQYLAAELSAR